VRSAASKLLLAACSLSVGCGAILGIGDIDFANHAPTGDASEDSPASDSAVDASDAGPVAKSCTEAGPGLSTCGPSGAENCCASELVPGGPFLRDNDFTFNGATTTPAQISSFRLDRFEITVARFRRFVADVVDNSWRPPAGSGRHTHLNDGRGLVSTGGLNEAGWDPTWTARLPTHVPDWTTALACIAADQTWGHSTWSPSVGTRETEPINCITWFEAYAFCIWDGGFLPSDAEWNYAAAGGGGPTGQRVYPWSDTHASAVIDCPYAVFGDGGVETVCPPAGPHAVGSTSPRGDGAFGQADLAGNLWEWTLDFWGDYVEPCNDCSSLTPTPNRTRRGGGFADGRWEVVVTYRSGEPPDYRQNFGLAGARCARVP
jgi:formylglycine-generating enzyme required for sulfatase activity